MHISTISAALWLVTILVQAAALLLALRRNQLELSIYLGYKLTKSLVLWQFQGHAVYADLYWLGVCLNPVASFVLLRGIFRQCFSPIKSLPEGALTRGAMGVSIFSALILFLAILDPTKSPFFAIDRAAGSVIASLLLVIVGYNNLLGIPWRSRTFGLTAGFALYTTVSIFTTALIARMPQFIHTLGYIDRIAWLTMLSVWVAYLVKPSIAPQSITLEEIDQLAKKTQGMSLHLKELTTHAQLASRHRSSRTA